MKILFLATDAYGGIGGIALYNRDLIFALSLLDEVSELLVVVRNMPLPYDTLPSKKIRLIESSSKSLFSYIKCSLMECFRLNTKDIIICGHINLIGIAFLIKCIRFSKLILLGYGIEVWNSPNILTKKILGCVKNIWVISHFTKNKMNLWLGRCTNDYVVLPNAISLSNYGIFPKDQKLINDYGLVNKKVILTISRLSSAERYKGHDQILELMHELLAINSDLIYCIGGDGDDRLRLQNKVKDLGLVDHVIFTGYISENEKIKYFNIADVFAMPSRGEGFGFVFLEALACGLPVIAGNCDGGAEALLNGRLGILVDPLNKKAMISAFVKAMQTSKNIPQELEYFDCPSYWDR